MNHPCSICKESKSEELFHNNKSRHSGKSSNCIDCDRERKRAYWKTPKGKASLARKQRLSDPEVKAARMKRYKDKKRKIVEDYKATGCEVCGYNKCSAALDLHHRDPSTKLDTVSNLVCDRTPAIVAAEVLKCIVLCANCHREHHSQNI